MRLRRCTAGILLLAGVLVLLGMVFDNPALFLASLPPLTFLALRASLFLRHARDAIQSLQADRAVLHRILSQGASTVVTLRLFYRIPVAFSLSIQDLPPAGTSVIQGDTASGRIEPGEGTLELRYRLRILSRGDLSFRGISIEASDAFFEDTIILGKGRVCLPTLYARPSNAPVSDLHERWGSREQERLRAIPGQGIRSFRRFQSGDDVRAIDWKLSVKHRQLMLREYMGRGGEIPMFLLDLPPELGEGEGLAYDRLLADLNARIESLIQEVPAIDLVVLSGGALIRLLTLQRDPRPWYRLLATLSPGEGYRPLFRQATAATLHAMERNAGKHARDARTGYDFFSRIAAITSYTAAGARKDPFVREIAAILSQDREIQLYTLGKGDPSHLRIMIEEASRKRIPVHLRLPAQAEDPVRRKQLLALGAKGVEVIR